MAMALRRANSSLINKLHYAATARVPSLPSTDVFVRSFNTKAPVLPYIVEISPYLIELPYMKGVGKGGIANEDESYAYFRQDVPGLGKKDIKLAREKSKMKMNMAGFGEVTHIITVEGEKEYELGEKVIVNGEEVGKKKFEMEYLLSPTVFNTDKLMMAINNGVLRILVPRWESDKEAFRARGPTLVGCDGEARIEWYVKEEKGKGLSVRIDMPGLAQHHVKVFLEKDEKTLVIEGQGDMESKFEGYGRRYIRCKLDITNFSKTERSTSMENGLFLLNIPPK